MVFATVVEYNVIKDTWGGMAPAERIKQITLKDLQQAGIVGTLAGLFAIAALT